jgi:hypothetical protein
MIAEMKDWRGGSKARHTSTRVLSSSLVDRLFRSCYRVLLLTEGQLPPPFRPLPAVPWILARMLFLANLMHNYCSLCWS